MRYLHFGSVRGDLQEGNGYASRCQFLLFLCRSPFFQSTKSGFLCFWGLRSPHFRAFRAQNRGFCALLPFGTLIFGRFEHKIGIFVLGKRDKWHREGERGRSCKTKSSEGQTTSTPRVRKRGARGRHMLPRAPSALRLQLLLVGCVLWVEVGPAGKPVV